MTIEICNRSECTGCGLCSAICPKSAITMVMDFNGFSFPELDTKRCIECELCQSACPVFSSPVFDTLSVPESYACWAKDTKLRKDSSSGGLFSVFANHILAQNGVVYGVVFNSELEVVFARTESDDGVRSMRGSKYIEAKTLNLFQQVATDLERGIPVLFSGTPCQNAALKRYLEIMRIRSSSLYQIDLICHGVSSPSLWKSSTKAIEAKYRDELRLVHFRDKSIGGWKSPAIRFSFRNRKDVLMSWSTVRLHLENAFILCYHKNLSLRSSCSHCRWIGLPRQGDITLADAQSLYHHPDFRTEARDGISTILLNTDKGRIIFLEVSEEIVFAPRPFDETRLSALPAKLHPLRNQFLNDAQRFDFLSLIEQYRSLLTPQFRFGTVLNGILKTVLGPRVSLFIREHFESVLGHFKRRKR